MFHTNRFGDGVYKDAIDPVTIQFDESLISNSTVLNEVSTSNFLLTGNSSRANINYVIDNFLVLDTTYLEIMFVLVGLLIRLAMGVKLEFYLSISSLEIDGVELINKTIVDYILDK